MNASGWINAHGFSGIRKDQVPKNVQDWLKRNLEREAMQNAYRIPTYPDYIKKIVEDPDYVAELPNVD